MSLNKSEFFFGGLFNLITPNNLIFRYQNFWQENGGIFVYNNLNYSYLPISYNPPNRNITASNQDISIVLPLVPAILAVVIGNDFFKFAVLEAFLLPYDFPTNPIIAQDKMVISSYQIVDSEESGGIVLVASSPFNAINGQFPRLVYTTGLGEGSNLIGYLPEVPLAGVSRGFN